MPTYLAQLLAIAGPPLGSQLTTLPAELAALAAPHEGLLEALLVNKNGFFVFEGALHVFPVGLSSEGYDLGAWNSRELWRAEYEGMADEYLFIAEDVFGGQFAIWQSATC